MYKGTLILTTAIVATTTVSMFSLTGLADPEESDSRGIVGPDVVCWYTGGSGGLDMENYGSGGEYLSYAFGTTSCNWGDQTATWGSLGNESYPVIAQNCYRLKDGRFEQIGTSWLKHSFCAVSEPGCGNCQWTDCSTLGIGCADTYWAGLNANATAPRSEINAYTGEYTYPFSIYPTGESWSRGRLLLAEDDISDASNPNAMYFIEGQYIASDEAVYSNQWNNCSWRQVDFSNMTQPTAINQTQVAEPAIFAWKEYDNDVDLQMIQVPNDGQLHVGARAYDNGDGTWDYEYAVHNMNSHRSVGTFSMNVGGVIVTDVGFNDADYHSGEVMDTTDWSWSQNGQELVWRTGNYNGNEWANAIRWGSMYNFRFTANVPPATTDVVLGLFRPGTPSEITISTVGPTGMPPSLIIYYPNGQPDFFDPNGGTTVDITIASGAADPVSGSAMLHWSTSGAEGNELLAELGGNNYQAVFPAFDCAATVDWYISVESTDGNTIFSPGNAPKSTWSGIALNPTSTEAGIEVQYYSLDDPYSLPDFEKLDPIGTEIVSQVNYPSTGGNFAGSGLSEYVGAVFIGYINVPTGDTYTLYVDSDDGSQLFIGEDLVVDNDGLHGMHEESGEIALASGLHAIRVEFFERGGIAGCIVRIAGGGMYKQVIPTSMWWHEVAIYGDINGDGYVNIHDLLELIAGWGTCGDPCVADLDGDGTVDIEDLLILIGNWGPWGPCE